MYNPHLLVKITPTKGWVSSNAKAQKEIRKNENI